MGDVDSTAVQGVEVRGYRRGTLSTDSWDQYVVPVKDRIVTFNGRVTTFVTPGRAAISQKILALHNAAGSSVLVCVNRITVDALQTVVKAVTVLPPIMRIQRFTAVPTNGTSLTKVAYGDTAQTSSSSVTAWGDSSADNSGAGTSSGTALTITPGAVIAQKYGPRMLTAVGYEPIDTAPYFYGEPDIILKAGEGLVLHLDMATVTTGNPTTDKWIAEIDWEEYTRP